MGAMKLLSLNMISLSCLQLLKNHMISCIQLQPHPQPIPNIKLIDSHGFVKIYHHPIHVSEVLLEFPKHLVCRSDSFYIGQKIPPLSDNDQLQLGHKYFLLPKHFFQSVLSFVTIASFFASTSQQQQQHHHHHPVSFSPNNQIINNNNSGGLMLKKAASCQQPFDIQRTASGCLRIRVSDDFISRLLEQGGDASKMDQQLTGEAKNKICTTPQLVKDYTQLVRRRNWKPKLETIRESHSHSHHMRKLSSFGIKRKNKKSSSKSKAKAKAKPKPTGGMRLDSEYCLQQRLSNSLKFPFKPKIRIKSNQGVNH